ncbi:EAL domain-containing protein [Pseudomonas sp. PCH446]
MKLDKSFVDDLERDASCRALSESVIGIGKGLGLHVVAEGIEQVAQRDILMAQGYEVGQGYLFSIPLPGEAFAQWVMAGDTERCVDEGCMVVTAITDNLSRP